jgi:hypothetical protein
VFVSLEGLAVLLDEGLQRNGQAAADRLDQVVGGGEHAGAPPPGVSAASSTRTECPSRASATAAASPLGPDPTTTASYPRFISRPRAWTVPNAPRVDGVVVRASKAVLGHGYVAAPSPAARSRDSPTSRPWRRSDAGRAALTTSCFSK